MKLSTAMIFSIACLIGMWIGWASSEYKDVPNPPTLRDQQEWMFAPDNHVCTKRQAKRMWHDYFVCSQDMRYKQEYCRGIATINNCDKVDI